MSKYKRSKGFFKHYNADGIACRIKVDYGVMNSRVVIKFKNIDEEGWKHHVPDKEFSSENEVVWFIVKNVEQSGMVFKVSPLEN